MLKPILSVFVAFAVAGCIADGSQGQSPQSSGAPAAEKPMQQTASTEAKAAPIAETKMKEEDKVKDATVGLTFLDTSGFNDDLSSGMREKNQEVAIEVPAKFSLNDIPERFDKWFTRVEESGGKVQAQPAPKEGQMATRGILGMLIDVAFTAYDAAQTELRYKPAEDYNVILQYDKDSGKVEKVLFYHR